MYIACFLTKSEGFFHTLELKTNSVFIEIPLVCEAQVSKKALWPKNANKLSFVVIVSFTYYFIESCYFRKMVLFCSRDL